MVQGVVTLMKIEVSEEAVPFVVNISSSSSPSVETKLINVVYSSVCPSDLIHRETFRIKAQCCFLKALLPLTVC